MDFPDIFVPVKTTPLPENSIELGTGFLIKGCIPSTIFKVVLLTNLGLVYSPLLLFS